MILFLNFFSIGFPIKIIVHRQTIATTIVVLWIVSFRRSESFERDMPPSPPSEQSLHSTILTIKEKTTFFNWIFFFSIFYRCLLLQWKFSFISAEIGSLSWELLECSRWKRFEQFPNSSCKIETPISKNFPLINRSSIYHIGSVYNGQQDIALNICPENIHRTPLHKHPILLPETNMTWLLVQQLQLNGWTCCFVLKRWKMLFVGMFEREILFFDFLQFLLYLYCTLVKMPIMIETRAAQLSKLWVEGSKK
jgi:hypothetical protein